MDPVDQPDEHVPDLVARVRELEAEKAALESRVSDLGELPKLAARVRTRNDKMETVGAEALRKVIFFGAHGVAVWAAIQGQALLAYLSVMVAWFLWDHEPAKKLGAKEASYNVRSRYRELLEQYGR